MKREVRIPLGTNGTAKTSVIATDMKPGKLLLRKRCERSQHTGSYEA